MKMPCLASRLSSENRSSYLLLGLLGTLLFVLPLRAQAGMKNAAPLARFPAEKVRALAPLLRASDVALIESNADGQMKQISMFTLAAASPAQVRDTLLDAARYVDIVRNFKTSKVTPRPDGTFDHFYELSYGLFTVDGTNRYMSLPADPSSDAPPVEMLDVDEGPSGTRHYRFEFYGAAGATVIAMYGYTNVRNSGGVVAKLFERVPQLEHGLALVSQAALILSIKQRAQQLAGSTPLLPAAGNAPYDFLLERGVVVLLRSQNGRLSDLSMIDQSSAQPLGLAAWIKQIGSWSAFVPTITRSESSGQQDDIARYELEQSLPLLSFRTGYGTRVSAANQSTSIDMMGLSGDLKGSRMRWDVTPGRSMASQVVLRSSVQFDRGSLVMRQLYKTEPLMEYGVNVGLQLVILRGLKLRAEQR